MGRLAFAAGACPAGRCVEEDDLLFSGKPVEGRPGVARLAQACSCASSSCCSALPGVRNPQASHRAVLQRILQTPPRPRFRAASGHWTKRCN